METIDFIVAIIIFAMISGVAWLLLNVIKLDQLMSMALTAALSFKGGALFVIYLFKKMKKEEEKLSS